MDPALRGWLILHPAVVLSALVARWRQRRARLARIARARALLPLCAAGTTLADLLGPPSLPDDVLSVIASFCDARALCCMRVISPEWRAAADRRALWARELQREHALDITTLRSPPADLRALFAALCRARRAAAVPAGALAELSLPAAAAQLVRAALVRAR
jgi:hypothetical protein